MKEYKRLTKRLMCSNAPFTEYASDNEVLQRLAELEDKIENGTLIELPFIQKGQYNKRWYVYYRKKTGNKNITWKMYYSKAEAEAKLKELQNER